MRDQRSLCHAKALRTEMTPAEARLWPLLRGKRFEGLKIRRQTVIGPFVVDFTCRSAMLAIEIDGDTHGMSGAAEADARRTRFIEDRGWRVVRFTNVEVVSNIEGVLEALAALLAPSP